ncbi:hypothetical protein Droror1_Dr00015213 [Drosera rotundifolia]
MVMVSAPTSQIEHLLFHPSRAIIKPLKHIHYLIQHISLLLCLLSDALDVNLLMLQDSSHGSGFFIGHIIIISIVMLPMFHYKWWNVLNFSFNIFSLVINFFFL